MKVNEINAGLILLLVAVVLWDLSRRNSFIRAVASQIADIGINDFLAGLFA